MKCWDDICEVGVIVIAGTEVEISSRVVHISLRRGETGGVYCPPLRCGLQSYPQLTGLFDLL